MSEQTTNPGGESSLSLNEAADAINNLYTSPESVESSDQPEEQEEVEEAASEGSEQEPGDEVVEDSEEEQPEAAEKQKEPSEDEVFLFGEEEVTAEQLREWREGGLRTADYTKKMQALAQERREWEEAKAKEETEFKNLWETRLAQWGDKLIDELKPFQDVDWDALRESDPYAYQIKWADYQRAEKRAAKLQNDMQKAIEEEKAAIQRQKEQQDVIEANTLKKLIPDFAEPAKAEALFGKMSSYLAGKNFSPAEIESISSAKAIQVIYDAMRYEEISSGTKNAIKKKVVEVSKTVKPGAPKTNKQLRNERSSATDKELRAKLRRSGRLTDAADLIAQQFRT